MKQLTYLTLFIFFLIGCGETTQPAQNVTEVTTERPTQTAEATATDAPTMTSEPTETVEPTATAILPQIEVVEIVVTEVYAEEIEYAPTPTPNANKLLLRVIPQEADATQAPFELYEDGRMVFTESGEEIFIDPDLADYFASDMNQYGLDLMFYLEDDFAISDSECPCMTIISLRQMPEDELDVYETAVIPAQITLNPDLSEYQQRKIQHEHIMLSNHLNWFLEWVQGSWQESILFSVQFPEERQRTPDYALTAKGEILTTEDDILGVLPLGSTYLELKHLNNLIHHDFLSVSSDPQLLLHDDVCQADCVEIFYFDFALNRHQTVFMHFDGEFSHIEATLLLELDSVLFPFED